MSLFLFKIIFFSCFDLKKLKKALDEISRLNEHKDDVEQKFKVLSKKLDEMQEEKSSLINEIDTLKVKMRQEDSARVDSNVELGKQLRLQQKLDAMQQELYKLESDREKYRVQYEASKAEQETLIEKVIFDCYH